MTLLPNNYVKQCYTLGFLAKHRTTNANHQNTVYVLGIVRDTHSRRLPSI